MKRYVALFILISPLFKGLYFPYEFCFAGAFLTLLLLLRRKKIYLDKSVFLYGLSCIAILYAFSILHPIDKGMAVYGALQFGVSFVFYFTVLQIFDDSESLIDYIVYSGIMLSVIGVTGVFIPYLSGLVLQNGRLGSVVQYPNSFGLYIIICIILLHDMKKSKKIFNFFASFFMYLAVLFTFSRSIYIFTFLAAVLCLLIKGQKRKEIFLGSVLSLLIGTALIYSSGLVYNFKRFEGVITEASEWQSRLMYYKDGLNIIAKYPLGLGFTGYYHIQGTMQTALYNVKLIHNGILQTALDSGVLCAVIYLIIFLYFFSNKNKLFTYKRIACLIIFLHGMIDFDWSFPIILNVLFLLFALESSKIKEYTIKDIYYGIFLVLGFIFLWMGISDYFYRMGDYKKALFFYPLHTEALLGSAEYYKERDSTKALLYTFKVEQLNNYFLKACELDRDIYIKRKEYDKALRSANKVMTLKPMGIENVEIYAKILLNAAETEVVYGKADKSKDYLYKILELPKYIKEQNKRVSKRAYKLKRVPTLIVTKKIIECINSAQKLLNKNY